MELSKEVCRKKIECKGMKEKLLSDRNKLKTKLKKQEFKHFCQTMVSKRNTKLVLDFVVKKHKKEFLKFIDDKITKDS